MSSCCVPNNTNSTGKDFSMRNFQSNSKRKAMWIKIINIHNATNHQNVLGKQQRIHLYAK